MFFIERLLELNKQGIHLINLSQDRKNYDMWNITISQGRHYGHYSHTDLNSCLDKAVESMEIAKAYVPQIVMTITAPIKKKYDLSDL